MPRVKNINCELCGRMYAWLYVAVCVALQTSAATGAVCSQEDTACLRAPLDLIDPVLLQANTACDAMC
jgi:hypothetical protein